MTMIQEMPKKTQRHHFDPSFKGDGLHGIDVVAKDPVGPDGIRCGDFNFQQVWTDPKDHSKGSGAMCMHWGNARQNNYHYIVVKGTKRVRKMTEEELDRHVSEWHNEDIYRWRMTADYDSTAPVSYATMVKYAVKKNVYIAAEIKSKTFGEGDIMEHLVKTANYYGHPPWFMALYRTMPGCRDKCAATIRGGGQFAVIFGTSQNNRTRFYAAVKTWPEKPTRVW